MFYVVIKNCVSFFVLFKLRSDNENINHIYIFKACCCICCFQFVVFVINYSNYLLFKETDDNRTFYLFILLGLLIF